MLEFDEFVVSECSRDQLVQPLDIISHSNNLAGEVNHEAILNSNEHDQSSFKRNHEVIHVVNHIEEICHLDDNDQTFKINPEIVIST